MVGFRVQNELVLRRALVEIHYFATKLYHKISGSLQLGKEKIETSLISVSLFVKMIGKLETEDEDSAGRLQRLVMPCHRESNQSYIHCEMP